MPDGHRATKEGHSHNGSVRGRRYHRIIPLRTHVCRYGEYESSKITRWSEQSQRPRAGGVSCFRYGYGIEITVRLYISVTLTGGVAAEERMRAQMAQQDVECKSWGAEPGSQAYMQCRAINYQK
jgi:hypothetical protein